MARHLNTNLILRIDPVLGRELRARARETDRSVSSLVRYILRRSLLNDASDEHRS